MKKSLIVALLITLSVSAQADQLVAQVQTALTEAGFYYGKADGTMGEETRAALRRFQIRNGLDVTGTTTPETLSALKVSKTEAPPPPNSGPAAEDEQRIAQTAKAPEVFLAPGRSQTPPAPPAREPTVVLQPERPPLESRGQNPVRDFFIDTDLENADPSTQTDVLLKAQIRLSHLGYFRSVPNGFPGPESETALLKFQHDCRLRLTGRLDADTRQALVDAPPEVQTKPFRSSKNRPSGSILRGIWVH